MTYPSSKERVTYPSSAEDTIAAFMIAEDDSSQKRRLFRLVVPTIFRINKLVPYRLPSHIDTIVIASLSVDGRKILPLTETPIPFQLFLDHQPVLPTVSRGDRIEIDILSESPLQKLGFAAVGKTIR